MVSFFFGGGRGEETAFLIDNLEKYKNLDTLILNVHTSGIYNSIEFI